MARRNLTAATIARRYAEDVLRGRIVAGKWARMACKRHLDDLKHGKERGLRFSEERAKHMVEFVSKVCRHVEGQWAGKLIALEPWQVFALSVLYGWEREDRTRRFRRSYEEVARKNAKSTRKAAESLYMLGTDGEQGAQIYTFATTFPQAEIVHRIADRMVDMNDRLRGGITQFSKRLVHRASGSYMTALHAKSKSQAGLNVHFGLADEFWAHKDRRMWDIIATATGARQQPLVSAITTAGENLAGPCYEMRDYLCKVLEGAVMDDEFFGIIYTLDDEEIDGDGWQDPATWGKANPNLGISVSKDDLLGKLKEARQVPSAGAAFKTLHLNIWVGALKAYYDLAKWNACGDSTLRIQDFRGVPCVMAFDLAQIYDTNAIVLIFERDGQYYVFPRFYMPEETVKPRDTEERVKGTGIYRHLWGWAQKGHVVLTPGDVVDFDRIEGDIIALNKEFQPIEVPYDSYQAGQMIQHLEDAGVPVVKFAPVAKFLSQTMKETAVWLAKKRIRHDANPVMQWMMTNVVGKPKGLDKVYPDKEFDQNKIDGPVAMLMALARLSAGDGKFIIIGEDYERL